MVLSYSCSKHTTVVSLRRLLGTRTVIEYTNVHHTVVNNGAHSQISTFSYIKLQKCVFHLFSTNEIDSVTVQKCSRSLSWPDVVNETKLVREMYSLLVLVSFECFCCSLGYVVIIFCLFLFCFWLFSLGCQCQMQVIGWKDSCAKLPITC